MCIVLSGVKLFESFFIKFMEFWQTKLFINILWHFTTAKPDKGTLKTSHLKQTRKLQGIPQIPPWDFTKSDFSLNFSRIPQNSKKSFLLWFSGGWNTLQRFFGVSTFQKNPGLYKYFLRTSRTFIHIVLEFIVQYVCMCDTHQNPLEILDINPFSKFL